MVALASPANNFLILRSLHPCSRHCSIAESITVLAVRLKIRAQPQYPQSERIERNLKNLFLDESWAVAEIDGKDAELEFCNLRYMSVWHNARGTRFYA